MADIDIYKKAEVAIANAHGIYLNHEERLKKAESAISSMLQKAEQGMNDDLYQNISSLLKKLSQTIKVFNEERSPVTQAAQAIVKAFTSQENALDFKKEGTDAYKLKVLMDRYVQAKEEEKRKIEQQQRAKIEKEREINAVRIKTKSAIEDFCNKVVYKMKGQIDDILQKINLEDFAYAKRQLTTFDNRIPEGLLKDLDVQVQSVYITDDEKKEVILEVSKSLEWDKFKEPYENEVAIYLHDAISKLPSIRRELEEIADADAKEQTRLLKIKQEREEQERLEKERQRQKDEESAKEKELTRMKQAELQAEFEFGSSKVESSTPLKVKHDYEIEIVPPAGLIDIVRFWASEQQWPMEEDKMLRWSFDRMKKFAEKEAGNDKFIESEYVIYRERVKSKI